MRRADSGIAFGTEAAEAEFYAGWLALTRLNDPAAAAKHFATIDRVGVTPITRARALYWEGRAAEADEGPDGGQRLLRGRRGCTTRPSTASWPRRSWASA